MPANSKAASSDAQKAALRWDEQPGFIANSHPCFIPDQTPDTQMLDLWTEFLRH